MQNDLLFPESYVRLAYSPFAGATVLRGDARWHLD